MRVTVALQLIGVEELSLPIVCPLDPRSFKDLVAKLDHHSLKERHMLPKNVFYSCAFQTLPGEYQYKQIIF